MMERVFDPYLIPGTNVLRNLVGATDEDALAAAENDLCSARAAILREDLPSAEGTLEQLRRIHRFLFRDVYDWAGEVRTIDMGKGEGLPFQPLELFSIGVRYSEEVLRGDDLLKGLGHDEFVKRLSVSYNNFNILHPFREGNGRTQRIFWEIIAREAGGISTGDSSTKGRTIKPRSRGCSETTCVLSRICSEESSSRCQNR